MPLTVEITDVKVKSAGENFKGQMHTLSAKMTLKDGETIVLERAFTERHKSIYSIAETMKKMRLKMDAVKKTFETEELLKKDAEKEVPAMITKLTEVE